MDKSAQLVVGVLLVAFVIERVTAAVTFFLDPIEPAARKRKLLLITIGGVLGAIALWRIDIRLLRDGVKVTASPWIDALLTWLVLVAGADRINTFMGTEAPSAPEAPPPVPEIKIFIEESDGKVKSVRQVS